MPISIKEAQTRAINSGFLSSLGETKDTVDLGITEAMLAEYGELFLKNLAKYAEQRQVVYKGEILTRSIFRIVDGNTLQIIVPEYFDYPNEGVRGVKSSSNAPNSPYRYKTLGMNEEGRRSIREYIESGHAKIANVKNDRAFGIGREGKHKKLIDVQTDTLVYLIKAFGLKKTDYFTDALKETFSDFEIKMSEAVGADIVFTLEKLNRKN